MAPRRKRKTRSDVRRPGYQLQDHVRFSVGALDLFNRFPPKLNAQLLQHENSFAYGDSLGIARYPFFSPFGINGGFYYAKANVNF